MDLGPERDPKGICQVPSLPPVHSCSDLPNPPSPIMNDIASPQKWYSLPCGDRAARWQAMLKTDCRYFVPQISPRTARGPEPIPSSENSASLCMQTPEKKAHQSENKIRSYATGTVGGSQCSPGVVGGGGGWWKQCCLGDAGRAALDALRQSAIPKVHIALGASLSPAPVSLSTGGPGSPGDTGECLTSADT